MKSPINRRDFLKLGSLLPLGLAGPGLLRMLAPAASGKKNVIVVVFDAWSAYNISLYGYGRPTTPNIARLAKRAIVYHNHFAGSTFTTSGTASLMTGDLPWTHRAINDNGQVAPSFVARSIFHAFQDYDRLAYTHNGWVSTLLDQFHRDVDDLIPRDKLFLGSYDNFIETLFRNDEDIATVSWARDMRISDGGYAYSLFLSHLYEVLQEGKVANLKPLFPRGLPTTGSDNGFLLEQAVDFITNLLTVVPQPLFGYFHFLPPHFPYHTSIEFYNRFKDDGYKPIQKPIDVFAGHKPVNNLPLHRTEYDEFVLYVDREFGRFVDALESSGLLENSWVVLTSDHGELFERGIMGHSTNVVYQPVIRVPLLIFEPGRQVGMDIHSMTSAVDVLPTLAHVTGHPIPEWTEGLLLPPYASASPDPNRSIYAVRSEGSDPSGPLTHASVGLMKGDYKLHYYFGYVNWGVNERVELYNIQADPEELVDLYPTQKDVGDQMLAEVKSKLAEVNKPYL